MPSLKSRAKSRVKNLIPPALLNATLLKFPRLYETSIVNFETNIVPGNGVQNLLDQLDKSLVATGDIIECGTSRAGSTALMGRRLVERSENRHIWACDSFEGFDLTELADERAAGLAVAGDKAFTSTSYDYVVAKMKALGLADRVTPVKGYFEETLPGRSSGEYCMIFIDCDLERSLTFCAETLWPALSSGGRIVFDDYASDIFRGARGAVDAFVQNHDDEITEHGMLSRLYYAVKK